MAGVAATCCDSRWGEPINTIRLVSIGLVIVLNAAQATAACPSTDQIDRFMKDWKAKAPTAGMAAGASLDDAMCAQGLLVERLKPELGETAGYKAELSSKALQERFGVSEPVRGQLLAGMFLQDGAAVPASGLPGNPQVSVSFK